MRRATVSEPGLVLMGPIKVKDEYLWNTRRVRVEVGRVIIPKRGGQKKKINLRRSCIRILDARQFVIATSKDTFTFKADTHPDLIEWIEALVAAKEKAGYELNEFDDVDHSGVKARGSTSSADVKEQLRQFRRKVTVLSRRMPSAPTTGALGALFGSSSADGSDTDSDRFDETDSDESSDEAALEAFRQKYGSVASTEENSASTAAAPAAATASKPTKVPSSANRSAALPLTNESTIGKRPSLAKKVSLKLDVAARRKSHKSNAAASAHTKTASSTGRRRSSLSQKVLEAAKRSATTSTSSWRKAFDDKRQRYYYYNKQTKEVTWKRPPEFNDTGGSRGKAKQQLSETAKPSSVRAVQTALQAKPAAQTSKCMSPKVVAAARASAGNSSLNGSQVSKKSTQGSQVSKKSTQGRSRKVLHDRRSGWSKILDPKSNRYYYSNKNTNKTVWSVPPDSVWARTADGLPTSGAASVGKPRTKHNEHAIFN